MRRRKNKTIGELAKEYIESRGIDSVMWGDVCLLHEIAEYVGLPHRSWRTERQVLAALDRCPLFEKQYVSLGPAGRGRWVRLFVIRGGVGGGDTPGIGGEGT